MAHSEYCMQMLVNVKSAHLLTILQFNDLLQNSCQLSKK